jgi:hypothetical protein
MEMEELLQLWLQRGEDWDLTLWWTRLSWSRKYCSYSSSSSLATTQTFSHNSTGVLAVAWQWESVRLKEMWRLWCFPARSSLRNFRRNIRDKMSNFNNSNHLSALPLPILEVVGLIKMPRKATSWVLETPSDKIVSSGSTSREREQSCNLVRAGVLVERPLRVLHFA